jgi:hypothetical protein
MPYADIEDHNNLMEGDSNDNVINESIDDGDATISVLYEEVPGRLAHWLVHVWDDMSVLGQCVISNHPMAIQRKFREAAAAISRNVLNYMESPDAPMRRRKPIDEEFSSLHGDSVPTNTLVRAIGWNLTKPYPWIYCGATEVRRHPDLRMQSDTMMAVTSTKMRVEQQIPPM